MPAQTLIYKINGPLFFAAAERVFDELLAQVRDHKVLILQMEAVSILDAGDSPPSSSLPDGMAKSGVRLKVAELQFQPLKTLAGQGAPGGGELEFYGSLEEAIRGEHLHEAVEN